ncbi:hypothetical protein VSDG_00440 [Cytospora chrysosperma]|uniref:Uncharacterized protein n=1 Tax=Cytospora chrysosperma TaxID=252740 RepID=A0A423WQ14_CYTCH|nr:hypothetical protein VSDG_00440 [Valsa sordida]
MVAEVGVHNDDVVAPGELQAVDVCGAQAELARAGLEGDVWGVGLHELVGDFLGAIGGAVVDNDEIPVDVAIERRDKEVGLELELGYWHRDGTTAKRGAYFSVNIRCSSQVMMGRFWRSLKVGRITE